MKKIKFTLEQATKAQRWIIGKAYYFFNPGARWGWVVNVTPRSLYRRGRDPAPIVQEAGWATRSVWTGEGKSRPLLGLDPRTVQPVASRCISVVSYLYHL